MSNASVGFTMVKRNVPDSTEAADVIDDKAMCTNGSAAADDQRWRGVST